VIEIAKDREYGNQDVWIPLWYEKGSRRLKSSSSERIIYNWCVDEEGFMAIPEDDPDVLPWL
jgi:hypothetical protein